MAKAANDYLKGSGGDYSLAIVNAQKSGASQSVINSLQQGRAEKINSQYGGKDPYKGSNQTVKSTMQGSSSVSSSQRDKNREIISTVGGSLYNSDGTKAVTNTGQSWKDGVDYSAEALKYAQQGDWDAVDDVLMRRQDKMNATGSTGGGKSNLELWNELNRLYNGPGNAAAGTAATGTRAGNSASLQSGEAADGYDSFQAYLDQMGYDDYSEATQNAIRAAVDQAVNRYRSQIETTNQDTEELARQAYIAKMQGEKNLEQKLSAGGYSGGLADSHRIALEAEYQNNLTELEKQRAETVKELEQAITNAQLTGDIQTAQELSAYLQNMQNQWNSYVQNQQALENQNYWNQQSLNAETTQNAYTRALNLLKAGLLPDDATLQAAGIDKTDAQALLTTSVTASAPVSQRKSTYNNGSLTADQVKILQNAAGVSEDGLWGNQSSNAYGGMTADEAWAKYGNQYNMGFEELKRTISRYMVLGAAERAQNILDKYWGSLSESQRNEIEELYS